ncbi:unnamed protein product [marine sediment metagenome]|uniref:Gamma-glutamyltranspeptidase n=1 Tax=marine sediment metagenome TaxID=412755 RepID=X1SLH2_9ZZZZ
MKETTPSGAETHVLGDIPFELTADLVIRLMKVRKVPPSLQRLVDGAVALERGHSESVVQGLQQAGHLVEVLDYGDPLFGGAQTILALDNGYCAASDPRRDGQAVVL